MDINNRIAVLIKALNLTAQKFAESVNTNASNIAHITSNRSKPSYPLLNAILNRYEDISPDWLMMGKGNLFRSENALYLKNIDTMELGEDIDTPTKNIEIVDTVSDDRFDVVLDNTESTSGMALDVPNQPEKSAESVVKTGVREVKKIILLYDDMSFEEFNK